MYKHELVGEYVKNVNPNSVFVEIGSDRYEGSTLYFADLAQENNILLHTVDINKDAKYNKTPDGFRTIEECWKNFYASIKDPQWPDVNSIQELPAHLQKECLDFGWQDTEESFVPPSSQHVSNYTLENHPNIVWHTCKGSMWAQNYDSTVGSPISVLYLDNFDYIWSLNNIDENSQLLIDEYKQKYNTVMNNQNCQIEHFKQANYLIDYMDNHSIVAFDDTYMINECWVGKCGPAVILFLSRGYNILEFIEEQSFVIMGK